MFCLVLTAVSSFFAIFARFHFNFFSSISSFTLTLDGEKSDYFLLHSSMIDDRAWLQCWDEREENLILIKVHDYIDNYGGEVTAPAKINKLNFCCCLCVARLTSERRVDEWTSKSSVIKLNFKGFSSPSIKLFLLFSDTCNFDRATT